MCAIGWQLHKSTVILILDTAHLGFETNLDSHMGCLFHH